ncbi:hypothetical protein J4207_00450, partial [Candidatus Woesearchaeota archaeon]|nr:hypothetical protein [Candidatus Woesearchaeota archaeon]
MKREVCVLVVLLLVLPFAQAGFVNVTLVDYTDFKDVRDPDAADGPKCVEGDLTSFITLCQERMGTGPKASLKTADCSGVDFGETLLKFHVRKPANRAISDIIHYGYMTFAGGPAVTCWFGAPAQITGVPINFVSAAKKYADADDPTFSTWEDTLKPWAPGQCGAVTSIIIPQRYFAEDNYLYCKAWAPPAVQSPRGFTLSRFSFEIEADYSEFGCVGPTASPTGRAWREELFDSGNACCGDDEYDFAVTIDGVRGDNGRVAVNPSTGKPSLLCYNDTTIADGTSSWGWHDAEVDGGEAFAIKPLPVVPAIPAPFVAAVPARDYISNKQDWLVCDAQHLGHLTIPSSLRGVDKARAAKFFCTNRGGEYRWMECCDKNAASSNERTCENDELPDREVYAGGSATQITSFASGDLTETMERSGDVLRIETNPQSGSHRLEITGWEDFTDLDIVYKVSSHYDVEVQTFNGNTLVHAAKLSELIEEDNPRIDGFMRAINPPTVDLTSVGPTKVGTQHWDCPVGKVACGAEDSGALGGGGYSDVLLGKVRCCDPKGFIVGAKSWAIIRAVHGEAICSNNGVICGIREGFSHLESFIKMEGVQCCSSSGIVIGARRLVSLAPRGSGTSGFLCQSGEVLCGVKPSSIENSFFAQGYCCAVTSSDPGKITRVDFRFVPKGDPSLPRSNVFTLRSAYLVAGGARYCTDARYSDIALKSSWISDLDDRTGGASIGSTYGEPAGKSACEALGFGWTGRKCCGDDGREYYDDDEAGCWNGEMVKDNTKMTVEYGQHAYSCSSGECVYPSETSTNQQPLLYNIFSDMEKTTASSVPQQILYTDEFLGCLRSDIPSMNPGLVITDVPLCSVHGNQKFLCSVLDEGWKERTVTEPQHVASIIPSVNILKNPRFDEFDSARIPKNWYEAVGSQYPHFIQGQSFVNETYNSTGKNLVIFQSNNRGIYGIVSDSYIVHPSVAFTASVNVSCIGGKTELQLLFWNKQQINWLSGYRVSTTEAERLVVSDIVPAWAERVTVLLSASNNGQPPVDCAFDDVQLVFNETGKPASIAFVPHSNFDETENYINPILGGYACCEENSCWDGKECVENMAATPDALPINNYRCVDGDWVASPEKTDLRGNTGFCPTEQQCLVSINGNNEFNNDANKFYISFKDEDWPQCIGDKQFVSDNYCDAGTWTSRTRLIAKELLDLVRVRGDPNKYTLYCDDYKHSLVSTNDQVLIDAIEGVPQLVTDANGITKIDASSLSCFADADAPCMNNFCVLKYVEGNTNKTVVGMSLNVNTSKVLPLFGFPPAACAGKGTNGFDNCLSTSAGTATVWFDDRSDILVYSRDGVNLQISPVQSLFAAIFTLVRSIFSFFTGTQALVNADVEFVEGTTQFDRLYLCAADSKLIIAVQETRGDKRFVLAQYLGFTENLCDYMQRISTTGLGVGDAVACSRTGGDITVY